LTLYQVTIRLEHNCPYTAFSKNLPDVVVQHWCSMERDVLEFSLPKSVDPTDLKREMTRLQKSLGSRFVRSHWLNQNLIIVVQKHDYSRMALNVNSTIEECDCLEIQPTAYRGGYEWYRIVALDQTDLLRLFRRLSKTADINVVSRSSLPDRSIRDMMTVSVHDLLGGLTNKQLKALLAALNYGYYNTPRRITTSHISQTMKSPRTTFETHLRKAEGKVLRAMIPYLELSYGSVDSVRPTTTDDSETSSRPRTSS
jgi:predicted DNA binding protein